MNDLEVRVYVKNCAGDRVLVRPVFQNVTCPECGHTERKDITAEVAIRHDFKDGYCAVCGGRPVTYKDIDRIMNEALARWSRRALSVESEDSFLKRLRGL